MRKLMLPLLLLTFGSVNANPQTPSKWVDENGNTVSDQRIIDLLEKCGVDDTANRIANFKGGDLEALIEEYKAAVACFEEEGFSRETDDEHSG
ncbi:hypothetical protein [Enterovibrio paralichthyis]|uniref:hypothetical protein n=1 Tax=Enterovibrio paralichthyis TaxID=2853805 RepID=UPI001C470059|nr:hypothetical protein [Enterovibrio paralichthyis]MBV7299268.1 hypothetical protein [Enterovibrio paralichthyis]